MDFQTNNNTDRIKTDLESRAARVNEECTRNFIRINISSIIEASPTIDRFSTWLIAGCGAIAALMINNVHSVLPFLGKVEFKISIYLLVVSVIFGLFQKYRSLCIQIFTAFTEKLITGSNSLNSIQQFQFQELSEEANRHGFQLNTGPQINLEKIRKEFFSLSPFIFRRKALKNFDQGAKDDLHGWRKMIKSFKRQVVYFLFQFLFFLIFLIFAASSV